MFLAFLSANGSLVILARINNFGERIGIGMFWINKFSKKKHYLAALMVSGCMVCIKFLETTLILNLEYLEFD